MNMEVSVIVKLAKGMATMTAVRVVLMTMMVMVMAHAGDDDVSETGFRAQGLGSDTKMLGVVRVRRLAIVEIRVRCHRIDGQRLCSTESKNPVCLLPVIIGK